MSQATHARLKRLWQHLSNGNDETQRRPTNCTFGNKKTSLKCTWRNSAIETKICRTAVPQLWRRKDILTGTDHEGQTEVGILHPLLGLRPCVLAQSCRPQQLATSVVSPKTWQVVLSGQHNSSARQALSSWPSRFWRCVALCTSRLSFHSHRYCSRNHSRLQTPRELASSLHRSKPLCLGLKDPSCRRHALAVHSSSMVHGTTCFNREFLALSPISLCLRGCATANMSRCPDDDAQSFMA